MLAHGFQRWYRAFIANAGLSTLTHGLYCWHRASNANAGLETLTRGFQRKRRALNANAGLSMLVQGFLTLMGKELLAELKRAIFKNWLKIHFRSGTQSANFGYLKMDTLAKSAYLCVPKNGTLGARTKILRPLI